MSQTEHTVCVIGSRGSDLALAQSRYIAERLRAVRPDLDVRIEIIQTRGDRILHVPLAEVASVSEGETPEAQLPAKGAPDAKGVFTKELEDALLAKRVDLAVHSYKDLPTLMPDGLCLAALPQRVAPEDCLLFVRNRLHSEAAPFLLSPEDAANPANAGRLRVGTSSIRRQALLKLRFPALDVIDLRGNVPTRINKLFLNADDPKRPDAILLARAGLDRLREAGYFAEHPEMRVLLDQLEIRPLPVDIFPPAPAQGALALQCRTADQRTRNLLDLLHDADVADCLEVERDLLRELEGGCHLPLGAHCYRLPVGSDQTHSVDGGHEYEAQIFLGADAADNPRGRSFAMRRRAQDPQTLTRRLLREMRGPLPVVIYGKAERIAELQARHARPEVEIIGLPGLRTIEIFGEDSRVGKDLDNWLMGQSPGARRMLAVFSVAGVRSLAHLVRQTGHRLDGVDWSVVGEKTAAALRTEFGAEPRWISPDSTGAGLARLIAESDEQGEQPDTVLGLSAEKGREEFYEILFEYGIPALKLALYRTEARAPESAELAALPEHAHIVFGSPSGVAAFFQGLERALPDAALRAAREANWSYAALGPTTASALRDHQRCVAVQSSSADYDILIEELSP